MLEKSYGITLQSEIEKEVDMHIEELEILGYTVVKNVLNEDELAVIRKKIGSAYMRSKSKFMEKRS